MKPRAYYVKTNKWVDFDICVTVHLKADFLNSQKLTSK